MWGPYVHRAADFFLVPKHGYEISHRLLPSYISTPSAFGDIRTGTHRPQGVFIAYGPDIKRGFTLKEPLFTWDIAPTIMHMFGLSKPAYFDGHALKRIFNKQSKPAKAHA
jgi:predicted AlkP superfamily phosphohydrolase/phosphomutase